jgi:surface antigen
VTVAALCALAAGGCSFPLDSLLRDTDAGRTGSIPIADKGHLASAAAPSEVDLAYARAAAAAAMARGGEDSSVPWQNPHTGAGGNITPLASARSEGGLPCRDFLASYVRGQSQAWLQGAACRSAQGKWEVKTLKPFKQG